MKRKLLSLSCIAVALVALAFTSCDTGSTTPAPTTPFTGTWSYDASGLAGGEYTFTGTSFTESGYINFLVVANWSGSGTYSYDEQAGTLTLTYASYTSSITGSLVPDPVTYNYVISGSTLTLIDPEDTEDEGSVYTKE